MSELPAGDTHDVIRRGGEVVAVGELTKWTVLRSWGPRKLASLADWRHHVVTLPYSERVAVR